MEVIKWRTCKVCSLEKTEKENFNFHSATGYYTNTCRECANKKRRLENPVVRGRREDSVFIRQKHCTICKETKDLTREYFYYSGRGFSKICICCSDKSKLEKRESKLNKGYLPDSATKKCIICEKEKSIINFSFSQKNKYYSSYCKPCDVNRKTEAKLSHSIERKEKDLQKGRDWHKNNPEKSALTKYNKFDIQRNLLNDLTAEYIKEQITKPCSYCQYPSTGLDRINNDLGHLQSNCVPCCWECNTARMNNFTYEEMLVIGQAIKLVKDNRKCQH